MDALQALREIVDGSGLTHRQIARRLGRYDSFVSQTLSRSATPQLDTLIDVAHTCGYDLMLVPRDGGKAISIGDDDADDVATDDVATIEHARALIHRAATLLDSIE